MNIVSARVMSNEDFSRTGKFQALIGEVDTIVEITYTSPFFMSNAGGLIAIPEIGSTILICKEEHSGISRDGTWYYLSTIVDSLDGSETRENKVLGQAGIPRIEDLPGGKETYKATGKPTQYRFESPKGNGLLLSDSKNEDYLNSKAELHSSAGKVLILDDSIDAIILRNEHGDRIKISTKSNGLSESRSIEIEAKGAIRLISRESDIDIWCIDGKNINIENQSTKSKQDPNFPNDIANINISSKHGDINITSEASDGEINLLTDGDDSKISISSGGEVDISAGGDMNLNAGGNVRVHGAQVHLN